MYKDIQFNIVYKTTRLKETYLSFDEDWLNQLGENWWYKAIFINFWTLSYSNLLLDGKIKQNKAGCKTVHVVQPYIWETQIVYICMYAKKKVWDVALTVV